ncbi:MAG: HIT domain-containing protein [Proteobacteria bacterium]|jgi:ATP adenylyltransferase|nr:HIT domain-containing protein [Pseudomonadota bacterium]
MDRVWAPWRMEYINSTADKSNNRCFLCVDGRDDEKALIVGRKNKAFVIMNRFPYTNGHVMVVPVRHTGLIEELTDEESLDMMALVKIMVAIFKEEFNVDGLNIGINVGRAAGAGLEEHTHIHIVPRWFGDTNFMPVVGETRVISEHIEASYKKLKRRFIEKVL